jgi:hypothetical protein
MAAKVGIELQRNCLFRKRITFTNVTVFVVSLRFTHYLQSSRQGVLN